MSREIDPEFSDNFSEARELAWRAITEIHSYAAETVTTDQPSTTEALVFRLLTHLQLVSEGVDALLAVQSSECASILIRSFYEASIKLQFLALQDPKDQEITAEEYSKLLWESGNRRVQTRASDAANIAARQRDPYSEKAFERVAKFEAETELSISSKERNTLNQKWAHTSLFDWVKARYIELGISPDVLGSLYHYGMSSHLLHADIIGLDLEFDHATRESSEMELKLIAECAARLGEIVHGWLQCAIAIQFLKGSSKSDLKPLFKHIEKFHTKSDHLIEVFFETREAFHEEN
ncbi:DUF5677 domain-containing protein [uncultured Aliiroseovarius sp.]|uniref:DUF5677 domain-containing protein n=1 Tax=uncultured Aliiroseovarius sp. TaxID=1658783 RepID=UPI0025992400|nr:DUF5677 domain-containing protein [uncultured Aliiroseovarius sp.]